MVDGIVVCVDILRFGLFHGGNGDHTYMNKASSNPTRRYIETVKSTSRRTLFFLVKVKEVNMRMALNLYHIR